MINLSITRGIAADRSLLATSPPIQYIGREVFVAGAVAELDRDEPVMFVKLASVGVLLESPEPQFGGTGLGYGKEGTAEAAALPFGEDVELFDPAIGEGDEADQVGIEGAPHFGLREQVVPDESSIFFGRVEGGERRKALVERAAHDLCGGGRVGEGQSADI